MVLKNSARENQRDFFQQTPAADPSRSESVKSFFRRRTNPMVAVSLEQIFITVVVLLILFVVVFMLGVLRGKAIRDAMLRWEENRITHSANPIAASEKLVGSPAVYRPSRTPASSHSAKPANPPTSAKAAAEFEKNLKKPYTIQLVTYPGRREERARKEMAELKSKDFAPRLFRRGGYLEICVGRYADRAEAEKDLRAFDVRYKGCFLTKKS